MSMNEMTIQPSADKQDAALWDLVQSVDLLDIRILRWHSELHDLQARTVDEIQPELESEFRIDEQSIQCRWTLDTQVRDSKGVKVADIGLTFLQVFAFTGRPMTHSITSGLVREFVEKTAVISVMPFIREAVQTMTVRLGLQPVTLGLARAGSTGPESYSVRGG
ncbi:hypothetical protein [Micromonospora violae]|uniref:hypothetical protein n=1 Tax=Micromonospora violae TaxID=1278207 RepID=UPI0033F2E5A2